MEKIIEGAFELGLPGFLLLIVLILAGLMMGKMFGIFKDQLKELTSEIKTNNTEIKNSNKELSVQLTKTLTTQEAISKTMSEAVTALNHNNIKIAIVEEKIDNTNKKLRDIDSKADITADKVDGVRLRLEQVLEFKK